MRADYARTTSQRQEAVDAPLLGAGRPAAARFAAVRRNCGLEPRRSDLNQDGHARLIQADHDHHNMLLDIFSDTTSSTRRKDRPTERSELRSRGWEGEVDSHRRLIREDGQHSCRARLIAIGRLGRGFE